MKERNLEMKNKETERMKYKNERKLEIKMKENV